MKNIFRIIHISKPYHKLFIILCVTIVFGAVIDLISPFLTKQIVDNLTTNVRNTETTRTLILLIVAVLLTNIVATLVTVAGNRLASHFADKVKTYLTHMFYRKAMTLPQTYFDNEMSGKIMNQLQRGITSIGEFFSMSASFIFPSFLQIIFVIIILAKYNFWIALLVAILFPLYIWISKLSDTIYRRYQHEMNAIDDVLRGRMAEVIANIKLVKGFGNQSQEVLYAKNSLQQINVIHARQSNMYHTIDFARNVGVHIILFGVSAIVFYQTYRGILTIGEMVLVLQLVNQVRRPLFGMSYIVSQIQNADTGSEKFFDLLGLESTESFDDIKKADALASSLMGNTIELHHVAFAYDPQKPVLRDINLILTQKQTVALVGKSGAGKSTLVNLIMRFYDPQNGHLKIDGKTYTNCLHTDIRSCMALVFQENELFSTTIRENVAYGMSATDNEIQHALRLAHAHDFVMKLPDGIDAKIGERGVKLSGGQKQRIQIARAILKNAPILILDEATSSLDAKSEFAVQQALENLMKDKLVLVIAHRFSTLQNVDKVAVLEEGVIVDFDSPQELARRPGIYHDLLQFQVEGNKKLLASYELY